MRKLLLLIVAVNMYTASLAQSYTWTNKTSNTVRVEYEYTALQQDPLLWQEFPPGKSGSFDHNTGSLVKAKITSGNGRWNGEFTILSIGSCDGCHAGGHYDILPRRQEDTPPPPPDKVYNISGTFVMVRVDGNNGEITLGKNPVYIRGTDGDPWLRRNREDIVSSPPAGREAMMIEKINSNDDVLTTGTPVKIRTITGDYYFRNVDRRFGLGGIDTGDIYLIKKANGSDGPVLAGDVVRIVPQSK